MSTITKEWLQQKISDMEAARDEIPFGLDEDDSNTLAALRIALASLEAEPAGCDACGGNGSVDIDHGEMGIEHIECPKCYTAPPAPVDVPDDVSGPLAHAYKELTPTFMRNHIDVFERYGIYPDGSAGIQAMRIALDGMNRRAAMLQGADGNSPVIPEGWVMLPAEPTQAMMNAWLSEIANWRGHAAGYRAMIAAAPQQEVKS